MSPSALLVAAALVAAPISAFAQAVPPGGPGSVTMTRAEYDRLLDLASRTPVADSAPPAALTRADVHVRADGASARSTMRLDGEVFRPGVTRLALIRNATLLAATLDGRALPLVAESGTHVALLTGPGPFSAAVDAGSALRYSPGRASFTLPVPLAASVTATIDVPGDLTDVRLSTGLVLRRSSAGGRTTVEATLQPGVPTEVSWSTHDSAPAGTPARDVRLLSDIKSIVTIGDADVRLVSLVSATVVQGNPAEIAIAIPAGFEVVGVTGASLERAETQDGRVTVVVSDASLRRHQFLLTLDRQHTSGSFAFETGFPTLPAAQRESGEVGVEGIGTLEVTSPDTPGLRRMDVREVDPALAAATSQALLAAYRYQRSAGAPPSLALDVRRFADAEVLAAVADRAVATTLVTTEGRALTEVTMTIRNRAQPFMKVGLPPGATMLSVEVAGLPAKPVEGADGSRVPLLRSGFRPDGSYTVSYVYLHAGTPFLKKGNMVMTLPKMDVPIDLVEWELFVPDRFRVDHFGGDVFNAGLIGTSNEVVFVTAGTGQGSGFAAGGASGALPAPLQRGQIAGQVVDSTGAPIPGVTVLIEGASAPQRVVTDARGIYVASNVPDGPISLTARLEGFASTHRTVQFNQRGQVDLTMTVGDVAESVAVSSSTPGAAGGRRQEEAKRDQPPSVNVQNLQRRASGVLPVRMDVPRAGTSHRFVKPLVIDEETRVTFHYKRR